MTAATANWQLKAQAQLPDWLVNQLRQRVSGSSGQFAAQLLWQRGLQDPQSVLAFLDPVHYQPTSPWAFGPEMQQAIARLQQARDHNETVFIWGDFDADGITATAVLWEGLGQFFEQDKTLHFLIPNRLRESHGLSIAGLDAIATQGGTLIVTCDTGSSNALELDYAQQLGLEVILTDHHTLPTERPPVAAFINSRIFARDHPLAHLSGVAVAYKLIEALYETLPQVPKAPLENLLDLVAIGLIADLVELTGDCRYLAQKGLVQLRQQLDHPTRPGVAKLLDLCQRTGDRPTDISFGLGPRINAISRIHGDAREGVELLTSRDPNRAEVLAESAEWTNLCRKEVQQQVTREAEAQLERLDLESVAVIVLSHPQWPVGVLGLVASQIAQIYGRPTILLSEASDGGQPRFARGSARSVRGLDLYDLMQRQTHLLHRFGGHPLAAGLSLPIENLPLLIASINQDCRQRLGQCPTPTLEIDLEVCLADIVPHQGTMLFRELQQLEPYGMGNPAPKLFIRHCRLENRRSSFSQTVAGRKVKYKKVQFELWDETTPTRFPGIWWGHDADEIPTGHCDVVIELDHGRLSKRRDYHARLLAIRSSSPALDLAPTEPWLLDWRSQSHPSAHNILSLEHCPHRWDEIDTWAQQAQTEHQKLALAYEDSVQSTPLQQWQHLAGVAKYAARTHCMMPLTQLQEQLQLSQTTLLLGLDALKAVGFGVHVGSEAVQIRGQPDPLTEADSAAATQVIQAFMGAIAEAQFQQTYFQRAPVEQLQDILERRLGIDPWVKTAKST